jgi:histidinol dehydrogenase
MQIKQFHTKEIDSFLNAYRKRNQLTNHPKASDVHYIVHQVCKSGDVAVAEFTTELDQITITPSTLRIPEEQLQDMVHTIDPSIKKNIEQLIRRVRAYHEKVHPTDMFVSEGKSYFAKRNTPLERIGILAPHTNLGYPISLLMYVIPAQVAGVQNIAVIIPPGKNTDTMIAMAHLLGITEVYKINSVAGIAAWAYGTESIPPVDKIFGIGGSLVALAKREVLGDVGVDRLNSMGELVILADKHADPEIIAVEILAASEYDIWTSNILVSSSIELIETVKNHLDSQLLKFPYRDRIELCLTNHGAFLQTTSLAESISTVNRLAPANLLILTSQPEETLSQIKHASTIFLGPYSSKVAGDYAAGMCHINASGGSARFTSPIGIDDFMKYSNVVFYHRQDLLADANQIIELTTWEGLYGHPQAIQKRIESN